MIPGKKYAPEDFLKIAWRRKWILMVPLVVCALGTFVWSRKLPDRYRSEAVVLIMPSQVPENYIRSGVSESVNQRLDLMQRQILSRARLERIIEEFDLYRPERKLLLMDQVVERMRRDVNVNVARMGRREDPNHFVVSFDSDNPRTAMLVAERLASLFVRENMEGRNVQMDVTIQFLQSQVDESLRQLREHESRLEAFNRANGGRLPSQVATNLQLIESGRQGIQGLGEELARDRERRIALERTIADETALGTLAPPTKPATRIEADQPPQPVAEQLAAARAMLEALLLRLKDNHPDVRIMRGRISELEKRAEAEALQQPVSGGSSGIAVSPAEAERQRRLSRLRGELDSVVRDIEKKQTRLQKDQATLQDYERRVQAAPGLESQVFNLMRDYGTVKTSYETLLKNLQDAKLAANLEQRQVGEQFRIIDPARRPDRPYGPNRVRMNLMGALAGLGLGLLVAGVLEYRDTALRTEEDVLVALSLPVLALVPTMRTSRDHRTHRRRRLLLGSSAVAMVIVSLAAVAWKLRLFEPWIG